MKALKAVFKRFLKTSDRTEGSVRIIEEGGELVPDGEHMPHPIIPDDSEPITTPGPPAPAGPEEIREILSRDWPVVSVVWVDAEARGGPGWEDAEDLVEFALRPLAEVRTVGLMIHTCDQYIALTDSRGPDQVGVVQKIPRSWIVSLDVMIPSEGDVPPTLSIDEARAG
jgi:hypothetical protein